MPQLHNDVYDNGLSAITANANELHILSADPGVATYANIATYTLGKKVSPTISSPENHTTGRKVTVSPVTDGAVTGTATANYFALVNTTGSKTLATGPLASSQMVTDGNVFTLTSLYVAIPAPA